MRFGKGKPNARLISGRPKTNASRTRLRNDYGSNWDEARCTKLKSVNYKCEKCGNPTATVHHIVPRSKGGSNAQYNLKALCNKCHESRHSHMRNK